MNPQRWRSRGTRIAIAAVATALSAPLLGGACSGPLATRAAEHGPGISVSPVLDGAAPLTAEASAALAELARQRAAVGARWLAQVTSSTGRYAYWYRPESDRYDRDQYNPIRHAGVTYALYQSLSITDDPSVRGAAERATAWIASSSAPADVGRAFEFDGVTKLGGQALAVIALIERRRVTGSTDQDGLIGDLAAFLLSMERPDQPGAYWNSHRDGERLPEPDSDYYPGEALLALTRLAFAFPDEAEYLAAARRAADYLVHVRDGDLPALGTAPRDDHWLTMALADLVALVPDEGYVTVVELQAERMMANAYTSSDGEPELIGASKGRDPVNYTSSATKGEALVAAWSLAARRGDEKLAIRLADAARRSAQFSLRVQYVEENTTDFEAPEHAVGAWPQDPTEPDVRMDFVQHNMSLLHGVWWMTSDGDLPRPGPG